MKNCITTLQWETLIVGVSPIIRKGNRHPEREKTITGKESYFAKGGNLIVSLCKI